MNITDIVKDSFTYPANHIKSLAVYMLLTILFAIIIVFSFGGVLLGSSTDSGAVAILSLLLGFALCFIIFMLIDGYILDIIKYGINRSNEAPKIDLVRQASNGIKLLIVNVVYFLIPLIILFILSFFLQDWILAVIGLILFIVFGLANYTAQCRLAESDDLGYALAINDAVNDIFRIGLIDLLKLLIIFAIAVIIVALIASLFGQVNEYLGSVVGGILDVYLLFFVNRATGLLYSNI